MPIGTVTYSFLSVNATIVGPNGIIVMGDGSAPAEEGITVEQAEPTNTRVNGADGSWMHSLHAGRPGRITFRFLKNSPTNALLSAMCNADLSNAATHGQNIITITNVLTGDVITGQGCAFSQQPNIGYAKDGVPVEWVFDVGRVTEMLGAGVQ